MTTSRQIRRQAKRLFQLCLAGGVIDEGRVRQVVTRLAESRRRDRFALLAIFHRLVALAYVQHTARVESAVALPPDLLARVESGLTRTYGPGLTITWKESPSLIGGMRIRVGDDVYDGSIRAKLAALEARL